MTYCLISINKTKHKNQKNQTKANKQNPVEQMVTQQGRLKGALREIINFQFFLSSITGDLLWATSYHMLMNKMNCSNKIVFHYWVFNKSTFWRILFVILFWFQMKLFMFNSTSFFIFTIAIPRLELLVHKLGERLFQIKWYFWHTQI